MFLAIIFSNIIFYVLIRQKGRILVKIPQMFR
jgi:hypothetical protein